MSRPLKLRERARLITELKNEQRRSLKKFTGQMRQFKEQLTLGEVNEFAEYVQAQAARQTLIDLLEGSGTIEDSVRFMVRYWSD